jgi:hypothetical protein
MQLVNSSTNVLHKIVTQYLKIVFPTRHYMGDQIKKEMDRACGINNTEECMYTILVEKRDGMRPTGRPRHRL